MRLRGFDRIPPASGRWPSPMRCCAAPTPKAVRQLLVAVDTGRTAALVGGGSEIRRLAHAALSLRAGVGTDHPELFVFRS